MLAFSDRTAEKIARSRRSQRRAATPYDRPPPKAPNWFTGVLIPSARALASTGGKILSAIFHESDYSSSDEDDDDCADDEYQSHSDEVNALNEENMTSPEMSQHGQGSQFDVPKTEIKHLIEQLIMLESFSREECAWLIKVLNSRVTDQSTEAGEKVSLATSPVKIVDHEEADRLNKAVLEAKKWFQEKKNESKCVHGTCNAVEHGGNGFGSPVDVPRSLVMRVESGVGSPVDVARSYMRERPPWASPVGPVELRTPLTTMNLFKERTASRSLSHETLPSSKRRDSLEFGSLKSEEELRRVYSKEADDMLRTTLGKIDLSLFAPTSGGSAGAGKPVSVSGDRMGWPDSFWTTMPIDPHSTKSGPPPTEVAEFGERFKITNEVAMMGKAELMNYVPQSERV